MNLRIIMACHNRRELTTSAVSAALQAADVAGIPATIYLLDDASTDGTAPAIAEAVPDARIIMGTGDFFWARSMATVEAHAMAEANDDDLIVWLNDDVELDVDAFVRAAEVHEDAPEAVIAFGLREPSTEAVSYAGFDRRGAHPLSFDTVEPLPDAPRVVDTFNGNFVVVPVPIARVLGGIDGGFSHALADIDYGLRCNAASVTVYLAPGTFGYCARNLIPAPGRTMDDWRRFVGPKGGGNFQSLRRIMSKDRPFSWPIFAASSYLLWWARRVRGLARR